MNFALLGADRESLALADAAFAARQTIVWQGDLAGGGAETRPQSGPDRGEAWEDLLDDELCDGIIIGRGAADPELRLRQVQELAKRGRAMLTTFPLFDSVLSYFEVDMARGEGGALLVHFNPLAAGDFLERAPQDLQGVEQIQCVRTLADRSRANVLRQLARDVDFMEGIAGSFNRVGAHGAAGDEAAYATLGVQLLGPSGMPVRWSVEPAAGREELSVDFLGEGGRERVAVDMDLPRAAKGMIERFSRAIVDSRRGESKAAEQLSTWPAALHAMEIADSIEISLRKGRMIELHAQQLTEELAFKGTMAAAGCGVLLVLVPLMLIAGWIAGAVGIPVARYWPHALLFLLASFLGVQVLSKLVYGGRSGE